MSLTKQECEKALNSLYKVADKLVLNHNIFIGSYDILKKLIQAHFSNPPLKFEELEVGKPYWDNLKECWFIVTEYDPTSYYKYKEINWYLDKNDACYLENIYENEFDENRYYRKQVEE